MPAQCVRGALAKPLGTSPDEAAEKPESDVWQSVGLNATSSWGVVSLYRFAGFILEAFAA